MDIHLVKITKLARAIAKVSFLTLISRVLGYIRDVFMASQLGTGVLNDVFIAAFKFTNLFRTIFGEGAFNTTFVPQFSGLLAHKGPKYAFFFASRMQAVLIIILTTFSGIMMLYMPVIITITTPGFTSSHYAYSTAIDLSRIIFPYLFFISLSTFYGGIMSSLGIFSPFAITSIILNIVMIIAAMFSKYALTPAHAFSYGALVAGMLELMWMLFFAGRYKLLLPVIQPKLTTQVKKALKNIFPSLIGSGVMQINVWVDMLIASFIPSGMSYLYFADRIMQLPLALTGTVIGMVLLPTLSRSIKLKHKARTDELTLFSANLVLFLTIPATFGLMALAEEIVQVLFMRGHFEQLSVDNTAQALKAFAVGLPAFSLSKVLITILYAYNDTKTPTRVAFYTLFSNIFFSILLLEILQHSGIALASSISGWINVVCLIIIISKRYKVHVCFYKNMLKFLIASILMFVTLMHLKSVYPIAGWEHLLIAIIVGMIVYSCALLCMRVNIPKILFSHLQT